MARKHRLPRYIREEPPSPRPPKTHRIEADLSQQAPNNSYGPPLYYEDYEFTCVDCGTAEIWKAEQQKWWYEVAKGSIYSGAKRCRACRNARRDAHGGTPRRSQQERREAEHPSDNE